MEEEVQYDMGANHHHSCSMDSIDGNICGFGINIDFEGENNVFEPPKVQQRGKKRGHGWRRPAWRQGRVCAIQL